MLGMSRQQIEVTIDEWYKNNPDKVSSLVQGLNVGSATDDDDVIQLVSRVMASVGSTVAMHAIADVLEQNNKILTQQINALIEEKLDWPIK